MDKVASIKCGERSSRFHLMSLLSKPSQVSHGGFGGLRRFWRVDHCLELVVADTTVPVLGYLYVGSTMMIIMLIMIVIMMMMVIMIVMMMMICQPGRRM